MGPDSLRGEHLLRPVHAAKPLAATPRAVPGAVVQWCSRGLHAKKTQDRAVTARHWQRRRRVLCRNAQQPRASVAVHDREMCYREPARTLAPTTRVWRKQNSLNVVLEPIWQRH
jgi:hypothetical protein